MGRQDHVIDHLVDEELVDREAADELRSSYGDDAAAALLVDRIVDEQTLLQHLALDYDLPPAGYLDGLFIERQLVDTLKPELIREYEVLPVRRRPNGDVDLIVVEPLNELAREVLEQHLEASIHPYIWPRLRHLQARHFFLGDDLPEWTRSYLRDQPVSLGYSSPEDDADLSRQTSASLHVLGWARSDVRDFIDSCFDRDTLLKVLLGYAGHWLTSRLMVVLVNDQLQPYFVEEWPELESQFDGTEGLRDIAVQASEHTLRDASSWQHGDASKLGLMPLFERLDVEPPSFLVTVPVRIGPRTAMSIIGVPTDRDTSLRIGDAFIDRFDLEGLERATNLVGTQLQKLIGLAKKDALPAPADRIPPVPRPDHHVGLGVEDSLIEQTIARRNQSEQKSHRWAIVDISEVVEESSPEEGDAASSSASTDDESRDSSLADAVDGALQSGDHKLAASESSDDVDSTSYGMPTLNEELSEELCGDSSFDEVTSADEPPSSYDDAAKPDSDASPDMGAEPSDELLPDGEPPTDERIPAGDDAPLADHVTPLPPAFEEPPPKNIGDDEAPSSDVLVSHSSSHSSNSEISETSAPSTSDSFLAVEPTSEPEPETGLADSISAPTDDANDVDLFGDSEPEDDARVPDSDLVSGTEEDDQADRSNSSSGPPGLTIPTGPSGLPLAQILRRPKPDDTVDDPNSSKTSTPTPQSDHKTEPNHGDDGQERDSVTGRTQMGVGEIRHIQDPESDPVVDEECASGSEASAPGVDSRASGTVELDANPSHTEDFGALLDDMGSEGGDTEDGAVSSLHQRPETIPDHVIEELSETSGPQAVELEHSLSLIDDPDPRKAFAAAEHLASAGPEVLPALKSIFPGRLFVDRYQYTVDTLPPVSEHGPVLEALVRIGKPARDLIDDFLDDVSPECRFYATFVLTELPADGLLTEIRQRLFDRDRQTRLVAKQIVFAHRHLDEFDSVIIAFLRDVLQKSDEEFRLEVAAENLRRFKDLASIPHLIEALEGAGDHLRKTLHRALREITYQPLAPSATEWRQWWSGVDDGDKKRWKWLVDAMASDDEELRLLALDEIEQIPGADVDYHPQQPEKLRLRAQKELTEFFTRHDR